MFSLWCASVFFLGAGMWHWIRENLDSGIVERGAWLRRRAGGAFMGGVLQIYKEQNHMSVYVHILSIPLFAIGGLNSEFCSSGVASSHVLVYLNILAISAYGILFRSPSLNNIV
jgi:hypothetical protein